MRSGLTFRPAVEREHDPIDVDAAAVVERDLRDLGAVAEEPRARDPAGAAFGQRRSPVRALGRELERAQRPRAAGEQLAPQVDRVATGRDRELVDRRLACELRMGVADRSPHHRRDPRLEVRRLEPEVLDRVRRVDRAGRREEVDAVREHHITDERQVHGRRLGHDLLMPRGQATVRVGPGPHAVGGHRAVAADLELLLAQRLDLDRVLPVERSRDLHCLGRRIVLGARVEPERSAGKRDVHLHLLLVDPGDRGGVHLHVLGRLGSRPTPRARRPRASGMPRCSAPSGRERGMATRMSRRPSRPRRPAPRRRRRRLGPSRRSRPIRAAGRARRAAPRCSAARRSCRPTRPPARAARAARRRTSRQRQRRPPRSERPP